jgi:VPDSG-CTERM motif
MSGPIKKIVALTFGLALMAPQSANALTIGADALLGIVVPGVPSNATNQMVMVNGLLEGWVSGGVEKRGFNDLNPDTVLGNNPLDPQSETYTLKFSGATVIPKPAPLATTKNPNVSTNNPTFNLGGFSYDWVAAKWGHDVAVYYIGNLAPGTDVTLSLDGTGFSAQGHGLSNYTLFNGREVPVPDGGTTLTLLGCALLGLGVLRRKLSA